MDKKNIVILGGGFGGIRAALTLADKLKVARLLGRYQVILVDRNEHHTYTPLLYKIAVPVAAGARPVSETRAARSFKKVLRGAPVSFVHGEVAELDLKRGDIHLARGEELACGYLVLAPGSETNYFGIKGLKENSLPLKTLANARAIRRALAELLAANPAARVLVGGGGPTGIEVAGELKRNHPRARVTIVEAMPTMLTGFHPGLLRAAEKRLARLGVEVIVNEPVAEVSAKWATTKNGREIPFDLFLWTGGVKAPDFLSALPLKTEPRGRVEVAAGMICLPESPDLKLGPMIYALGDSVCVYDPVTGKPLPGVAPAAIEQGEVAAHNIFMDILKAEGLEREYRAERAVYRHKERPYVMPVGGRWAVARLGPFVFTGILPWLFARAVEIDYRLSLR